MPGKPLIIAEKPSAARSIAEALGGFATRDGYMESEQYCLSWAIGHLVEQLAPEEYDSRWKRWSLETLPIIPDEFSLKVVAKTRSQFQTLSRLGKQATSFINACDAGREGELIFRYIYRAAGFRAPVRRLWVSALTREAIRKAFARLGPASEYERLYQSALCRAQGDWLVGMNATRAFTVKWGELLSAGRVQTPTLAMLVRREQEIEAFRPEAYWEVQAQFGASQRRQYEGKWFGPDGDRLKSAAAAEAVVQRVKGQAGVVESSEERPAVERPPQLFDLTSLQREANRRFGLTAAATLKAAQSLYEAKRITYPRTDSRYLSKELVAELPRVVRGLGSLAEYQSLAGEADLGRVHRGNRRVVDDAKVTDHHAIIPTPEVPRGLSGVEAKLYDLIARRFLAQFFPDARFLEREVITRVGTLPDRFRSRGRQVLDEGWRVVEPEPPKRQRKGEESDEEAARQPLPPLQTGEAVRVERVDSLEKTTKPPKRYTEATLLSAMEYAGKEVTDEALKEAMKGRGLGTPATRAAIIERLKQMSYIVAEKKHLVPTEKGHRLVELAEQAGAAVLLSPELTGEWERRIADIQAGTYDPARFMQEIRGLTGQLVEHVKTAQGGAPAPGRSTAGRAPASAGSPGAADDDVPVTQTLALPCPRCGGTIAKGGKGWTCGNPECGLRIPGYLCGKVLDSGVAEALVKKGKTPLITGFTSPRTGRSFSSFLVLNEDGQVGFEFPPNRGRGRSGAGTASAGRSGGARTSAARRKAAADTPTGERASTARKSATRSSTGGVGRKAGARRTAGKD